MGKGDGCGGWQSSKSKRRVMTERQRIQMMRFNTSKVTQNTKQTDRSQKKTTQNALGLLEQTNSSGRRFIEVGLTQLSGEQMKQCEWQGEQCNRESGGECV